MLSDHGSRVLDRQLSELGWLAGWGFAFHACVRPNIGESTEYRPDTTR